MCLYWRTHKKDQAIETLIKINWSGKFEFSKDMYPFGLKEKEFIALKQSDREKIIAKINKDAKLLRLICKEVILRAHEFSNQEQYDEAEIYFNASLHLGKILNRPGLILMGRLMGFAIEKKTLQSMQVYYKKTNRPDKAKQARQKREKLDIERKRLIKNL